MPIPASLKIPDIPGGSKIQGREDEIEVVGFRHEVYMPTDRKDGSATGTRVHQDFVLVKNFDKASPKLHEYLCNGKVIPSATMRWHMPDVDNPSNEQYKHMEEVSMRYEKIKWLFTDGNIEYEDSWIEGR
jgi:type VI secretion system secreted protein Hcp